MLKRLHCLALVVCSLLSMTTSSALTDDNVKLETTVALTALVPEDSGEPSITLINSLLDLLSVDVLSKPGLSVVERRQISLALHELALSKDLGRNAESRLQLGKIASADLILTLEYQSGEQAAAEQEDDSPRVLIRIVESLTGIIRGVSVTTVDEGRIDEASTQIADYLAMINARPQQPLVTVAVAPFESKGRFDRLRPLERGLRDMMSIRLRKWSESFVEQNTRANIEGRPNDEQREGKAAPDGRPLPSTVSGFQVLQRSGMEELLREVELIQSGLVDADRLPGTLPTRAAAFLIQGTIDETNTDETFRIIVVSQLVHAASGKVLREFRFETTPKELEPALAHQADLFAGYLVGAAEDVSSARGPLHEIHEVQSIFENVLADLRRFRRLRPIDFSSRDFALRGKSSGPAIKADSVLGQAVLKKSIDRLETTLFLQPENMHAAYALGFCLAFQIEGIGQPDRADELLRKVGLAATESTLRADALRLLAEISYHHFNGHVDKRNPEKAAEQLAFALIHIPAEQRDEMWARLTELLASALPHCRDEKLVESVLNFSQEQANLEDSPHRGRFAALAIRTAAHLKKLRPGSQPEMSVSMAKALEGNDPVLVETVARHLASEALKKKDFVGAAEVLLKAVHALERTESKAHRAVAQNLYVHAARNLRQADQHEEARRLLEGFEPINAASLNAGYRAVELGRCYMHDGENERALRLLVAAAENCPGLVDNSEVENLINQLGGVPLRDDRDVDVEYVDGSNGKPVIARVLTTDGKRLYCAGEFPGGIATGVQMLDPQTKAWTTLTVDPGRVTDMEIRGTLLWVATESNGLWRYDLTTAQWRSFSEIHGLPDNRVSRVVSVADGAYVGVGVQGAGGVVHVDHNGSITVLDGRNAPSSVPTSMALTGQALIVATQTSLHEWNPETRQWTANYTPELRFDQVFAGQKHAWRSRFGRELMPYDAGEQEGQRFQAAWFNGQGQTGYRVRFVVEHAGQVWFGGSPRERFRSIGFYRIDPKNGEFRIYNLGDGFRSSVTYETHDGVAIRDDIWLATSTGLARVTPRMAERIE